MKARVNIGYFGGKVEIKNGNVVIEGREDFLIEMEETALPGVISVLIRSADDIAYKLDDGWTFNIKRGIYEKDYLLVTRYRWNESGTRDEEYLTRMGKWEPSPKGYGPYPSNIMKIPAPALEAVPV